MVTFLLNPDEVQQLSIVLGNPTDGAEKKDFMDEFQLYKPVEKVGAMQMFYFQKQADAQKFADALK